MTQPTTAPSRLGTYRFLAVALGILAILASIWAPKVIAANQHAGAGPVHHTQTLRFVLDGDATSAVAQYTDITGTHITGTRLGVPIGVDITVTDLRSFALAVVAQNGGCEVLVDGTTGAESGSNVGTDPGVVDLCASSD